MINNENTMYMYCNILGQTEPEKILDIGLFYRQIGGVSTTILNSDVPKKCFITGIDLENSKNYGVYNTIYDEIIRTEDIAGLSDAEYDLAVFLDKKIKGLERKNLFDFVKSNCKCIFAYETDDVYLQNWENKRKLNVNNVTGILAWR